MTLARTGIVQAEGKHLGQGAAPTRSLQLLLGHIAAGKVDVVVVYKIGRLTRSLSDFSRIVEIFEKASTSFVSVTQAFNTTTSMGRLMLNVLLWFAQCERELTGERIRSKLRTTSSGKTSGGTAFSRGALFHLLRNRIYLGQIVHRAVAHNGEHEGIVDTDLFARVQQMLDGNARRHRRAADHRIVKAPLTGKLFDATGEPMSPTFSRGKSGRAYC